MAGESLFRQMEIEAFRAGIHHELKNLLDGLVKKHDNCFEVELLIIVEILCKMML